ncbi:hypothetical protein [Neorhizobium sp. P12A]|uniref:hypothetical protein n=1 Tax=Neorhizobium sp. P12A TaxID=2268027 RepID=UPI00165D8EE5|nr:hypothetical protein [Neorhizobium sp. P12A]
MVSALATTRLISAQLALQMLQTDVPTSSSSDDPLLGDFGDVSNLPSQSQASLTSLLNGLPSTDQTSASEPTTGASTDDPDMTSSDFMSLLQSNLQTAVQNGDSGQAQAMLNAIANGTLTVTDPTAGQSITAWNPDNSDNTGSTSTDTTGNDATTVPTQDWNDFLNAHLTRGSDAAFVKNSDGSYTDKVTGEESYFGQVGNQFYYLSWPAASAGSADSSASGSTASSTGTTSSSSTNTGA